MRVRAEAVLATCAIMCAACVACIAGCGMRLLAVALVLAMVVVQF